MNPGQFFQKHKRSLIAAFIGAAAGFAYWYFIGCKNGACLIQSNPWISTPYGALLGVLFAHSFSFRKRDEKEKPLPDSDVQDSIPN